MSLWLFRAAAMSIFGNPDGVMEAAEVLALGKDGIGGCDATETACRDGGWLLGGCEEGGSSFLTSTGGCGGPDGVMDRLLLLVLLIRSDGVDTVIGGLTSMIFLSSILIFGSPGLRPKGSLPVLCLFSGQSFCLSLKKKHTIHLVLFYF